MWQYREGIHLSRGQIHRKKPRDPCEQVEHQSTERLCGDEKLLLVGYISKSMASRWFPSMQCL